MILPAFLMTQVWILLVICLLIFLSAVLIYLFISWLQWLVTLYSIGFTLFSLDYFNNTSTSKLVKSNLISSVIVEYFTRLILNIIGINKAILMFLFRIILVCRTLLFLYYEITPDTANKFNNNVLLELYNGKTELISKYPFYNVAMET